MNRAKRVEQMRGTASAGQPVSASKKAGLLFGAAVLTIGFAWMYFTTTKSFVEEEGKPKFFTSIPDAAYYTASLVFNICMPVLGIYSFGEKLLSKQLTGKMLVLSLFMAFCTAFENSATYYEEDVTKNWMWLIWFLISRTIVCADSVEEAIANGKKHKGLFAVLMLLAYGFNIGFVIGSTNFLAEKVLGYEANPNDLAYQQAFNSDGKAIGALIFSLIFITPSLASLCANSLYKLGESVSGLGRRVSQLSCGTLSSNCCRRETAVHAVLGVFVTGLIGLAILSGAASLYANAKAFGGVSKTLGLGVGVTCALPAASLVNAKYAVLLLFKGYDALVPTLKNKLGMHL